MTEPDVTLTDYGLAILCVGVVSAVMRKATSQRRYKALWLAFFASIGAASVLGGTVHGFFLDERSVGYQVLWPLTLLCIGVTTAVGWMLTGAMAAPGRGFVGWFAFSILVFVAYAATILFYAQSFAIVVAAYMPAMAALFSVTVWRYLCTRARHFRWIAGGIFVSFIAAALQYAGIAVHPQYFNHNATYHIVQAAALWVLFIGARGQLAIKEDQ